MKAVTMALCVLVIHGSTLVAQNGSSTPAVTGQTLPSDSASPVDPPAPADAGLPVSLKRIRLQLSDAPPTKRFNLKIEETVQVVGVAPPMQLWSPERAKLAFGPVPYGAPTHKDFINLHTPEEFRNYPMDLNALLQWLMEQFHKKTTE